MAKRVLWEGEYFRARVVRVDADMAIMDVERQTNPLEGWDQVREMIAPYRVWYPHRLTGHREPRKSWFYKIIGKYQLSIEEAAMQVVQKAMRLDRRQQETQVQVKKTEARVEAIAEVHAIASAL